MIANSIILLFILGMVVIWATYGAFSALLHLVATVIAGALAIALWEPLVMGFLITRQPSIAWGVGLLGPFAILLIVIRVGFDSFIKNNLATPPMVDRLAGGFFGFLSAVLTTGMLVLGLSYLPLSEDLGGYKPYAVQVTGQVEDTGTSLWIPVDSLTAGFYTRLSNGALSPWSGRSLAEERPHWREMSLSARIRADENASLSAAPGEVSVQRVVVAPQDLRGLPTPVADAIGKHLDNPGVRLVVVDTRFENKGLQTYNRTTLYLPPSQLRLVVRKPGSDAEPQLLQPVAFTKRQEGDDEQIGDRVLYPINSSTIQANVAGQPGTFGWVFAVPTDAELDQFWVRNLRLGLPEPQNNATDMIAVLGDLRPEATVADGGNGTGTELGGPEGFVAGQVGSFIELTNQFPASFNINSAPGLNTVDAAKRGLVVVSGSATTERGGGGVATRVNGISVPSQVEMARLKVERDAALSLLGQARAAAVAIQGVYIQTNTGQQIFPMAYALYNPTTGQMKLSVLEYGTFDSATQLPINDMTPQHELYLYFVVPRGVTLETYHIGTQTQQDIGLEVPG